MWAQIRKLLSTGEGLNAYGLGRDRTLAQFFEMCDVDFSKCEHIIKWCSADGLGQATNRSPWGIGWLCRGII